MGLLDGAMGLGIEVLPAGFVRGRAEGFLKNSLNAFSKNPRINIDNKSGVIEIGCCLYGENEETRMSIVYDIWKETDASKDYKRYVMQVSKFESSKEWLSIIAQNHIVGCNLVWYEKSIYLDRIHIQKEKVIWMREINGNLIKSKPSGKIIYIPNTSFPRDSYRKAAYKSLKK